jgi:hypothetical protein
MKTIHTLTLYNRAIRRKVLISLRFNFNIILPFTPVSLQWTLLPPDFRPKILYAFKISPMRATFSAYFTLLALINPGTPKEQNHQEDLNVDVMISKRNLVKCDGAEVWTEFIRLRPQASGGLL